MRCPHCHRKISEADMGMEALPLTKRQAEIYRFVAGYQWAHSYAPTFDEIADAFGYSTVSTVHEHLSNLERKGWLRRQYNQPRGLACLVSMEEMRPEEAVGVMDEIARQAVQMEEAEELRK